RDAGTTSYVSIFRIFLQRMRKRGVLAIEAKERLDDEGSICCVRLLREDADLRPFERAFLQKFFPQGRRDIDSEEFQRIHENEGFNPDVVLEVKIDEHEEPVSSASPVNPSRFWKLVRAVSPLLFVSSFIAVVIEAFQLESPNFLVAAFVGAICFLAVPMLPALFRRHQSGATAGLLTLMPIVPAVFGVISFHLISTVPLGPIGSVGIALFALWSVAAMLQIVRTEDDVWSSSQLTVGGQAQRYIRSELKRPAPELDDEWILHLVALGFFDAIQSWKECGISTTAPAVLPLTPGQLPTTQSLRPFVGNLSGFLNAEWADTFHVLPKEEREEWEVEEDDSEDEQQQR
ncbi:MAG TPA: hypothetical protein VFG14_03695, partial [Chthoniobacteraceae bacterium]|nr:hypothetical protein [Chthoniobacteraceae bacterium]